MIDFDRLTLTDVKPSEAASTTLDIDQYIGLSFASPAGPQGQGCIVIKDSDSGGFVELSISLASGRLVGATLVGRPSRVLQGKSVPAMGKRSNGLPLFAQHGFAPDAFMPRTAITAALTLETSAETAYISWNKAPPDQRVGCGRAFFAFAAGRLVGFGAAPLTAVELSALSASLG